MFKDTTGNTKRKWEVRNTLKNSREYSSVKNNNYYRNNKQGNGNHISIQKF